MAKNQRIGGVLAALILALAPVSDRLYAATSSALVDVSVVLTIAIANLTGLSFGAVSAGTTPGTVTVAPDGTVSASGGVKVGDTGAVSAATFLLNGQPDTAFSIQLPSSLVLSSPSGDVMTVSGFTSQPNVTGQLDSSGAYVLRVGGTLQVGSAQQPGNYTGLMEVAVSYN